MEKSFIAHADLLNTILETESIHNTYTNTDRRLVAIPWEYSALKLINGEFTTVIIGTILRITLTKPYQLVYNSNFTGKALTCFLDKKYEGCKILSIKITKINPHSVFAEPVEFAKE
jgi:hypothetical protein